MYMSRITLEPDAPTRTLARIAQGDGYNDHRILWRLFSDGPDRDRDFLYRRESDTRTPSFLAVSARRPHDPDRLWRISTKDYSPKLITGQPLTFALRANPVVTRRNARDKPVRHDLVMDAKKQLTREGVSAADRPSQAVLSQRAAEQWLTARAARCGFKLMTSTLLAEAYRLHRFRSGNGRVVQLSTLDISGSLTVDDPERLLSVLYSGIGPAKAFGCGLMLVRMT